MGLSNNSSGQQTEFYSQELFFSTLEWCYLFHFLKGVIQQYCCIQQPYVVKFFLTAIATTIIHSSLQFHLTLLPQFPGQSVVFLTATCSILWRCSFVLCTSRGYTLPQIISSQLNNDLTFPPSSFAAHWKGLIRDMPHDDATYFSTKQEVLCRTSLSTERCFKTFVNDLHFGNRKFTEFHVSFTTLQMCLLKIAFF